MSNVIDYFEKLRTSDEAKVYFFNEASYAHG